ncbi:uncharacterized protein V6R79_022215 [Siganus canaliculatus]
MERRVSPGRRRETGLVRVHGDSRHAAEAAACQMPLPPRRSERRPFCFSSRTITISLHHNQTQIACAPERIQLGSGELSVDNGQTHKRCCAVDYDLNNVALRDLRRLERQATAAAATAAAARSNSSCCVLHYGSFKLLWTPSSESHVVLDFLCRSDFTPPSSWTPVNSSLHMKLMEMEVVSRQVAALAGEVSTPCGLIHFSGRCNL